MVESWVWRVEICDCRGEGWVCGLVVVVDGRGGSVEGDVSGGMEFLAGGGGKTGSWLAGFASGDNGAGASWMEGSGLRSALEVEGLGCVGGVGIGGEGALSAAGSVAASSSGGTSALCTLGSVRWRSASGSAVILGFAEAFVACFAVAFWPPLFRLDAGMA